MTFQRIAKTATSKPKIQTTSQFEPRPFTPITQHKKLAPHQQGQATQARIQTKTNLLEILNFRIEPKKTNLPNQLVQAKLMIGEPGDKYEKEADETARQVVQRIHQPQSQIQQQSLSADTTTLEQHKRTNLVLQNKRLLQCSVSGGGITTAPDLEVSIQKARSGGQPLAKNIRQPMEQTFGADFSRVKVHTDTQSDSLNRSIQAKAFTTGQNVFFRQGEYNPNSRGGQELLAHELTHVVQQNGSGSAVQANSGLMQRTPDEEDTFFGDLNFDLASEDPKVADPDILDKHKGKKLLIPANTTSWEFQKAHRFCGKDIPHSIDKDEDFSSDIDQVVDILLEAVIEGKKGYVFSPDEFYNYWVAETDTTLLEPGFKKTNEPLFPTDQSGKPRLPSPDDVRQGNIGDCYLMAAIASIAKTDPQYILTMFRDYGDTVSVRLYDTDKSDPLKVKFTPRYIKVDKSVAKDVQGKLLYNQGALWVSMLEKAYAAGGFGGTHQITKDQTISPSYKKIEAGSSADAFEVLLGKAAIEIRIPTTGGFFKADFMPWSQQERDAYNIAKSTNNYQQLASYNIFKKDVQKIHQWMDWLTQKQGLQAIQTLDNKLNGSYQEEIRLEDFELIFKAKGLDAILINDLMNHLQGGFSGKKGTGNYSKLQLDFYNKINSNILTGKFITVTTNKNIGRKITASGHSAGEPISKGLVGMHEYTITGCKHDKGSGLRYIKLRNPWGNYGRDYDMNASKGNKAKENQQAHSEFDLELSDFTKRFNFLKADI
ncbi:DUF4157 domain-containing protein [Nostoc sp. C117]|uniref:eCIS core domain-containing protein n=1 Tax=Nostoc sp. C117 TaxID=3349875 RepID=UPI00370DC8BE